MAAQIPEFTEIDIGDVTLHVMAKRVRLKRDDKSGVFDTFTVGEPVGAFGDDAEKTALTLAVATKMLAALRPTTCHHRQSFADDGAYDRVLEAIEKFGGREKRGAIGRALAQVDKHTPLLAPRGKDEPGHKDRGRALREWLKRQDANRNTVEAP